MGWLSDPPALAAVILAVLAPLPTAKNPKNIACSYKTEHHGNTFSIYVSLNVADSEKKTWRYVCTRDRFPGKRTSRVDELIGTYELLDDLTVVTGEAVAREEGKKTTRAIRFGVNFGSVSGRTVFNGFFPAPGDTLRFHRQWYAQRGNEWTLAEERIASFAAAAVKKNAQTWQVPLTAERSRWDNAGKKSTERFAGIVTCTKGAHRWYSWPLDSSVPAWLTRALEPHFAGDQVEAVTLGGGSFTDISGIDPKIADPPQL